MPVSIIPQATLISSVSSRVSGERRFSLGDEATSGQHETEEAGGEDVPMPEDTLSRSPSKAVTVGPAQCGARFDSNTEAKLIDLVFFPLRS